MNARVEKKGDSGWCVRFGCTVQGIAISIGDRRVRAVVKQVACDFDMAGRGGDQDGSGAHIVRLQVDLFHLAVKGLLEDLEMAERGEHVKSFRALCFFGTPVLLAVACDEAGHLTEVDTMRIRRHEVDDSCLHARIVGAG